MVYFIRAKSYFKYAQDLFSSLKESYQALSEEEFLKKSQDVVFVALKALWALSQITPPEKSPEFKEVFDTALSSLSPEKKKLLKTSISQLNSLNDKEKILNLVEKILSLVKEELSPILH